MEAYAQRKGIQATSLRFMLDGELIKEDQTPKMLELEDNDQIDCFLAQTGGFWFLGEEEETSCWDNKGEWTREELFHLQGGYWILATAFDDW